jgi:hypothetical protein
MKKAGETAVVKVLREGKELELEVEVNPVSADLIGNRAFSISLILSCWQPVERRVVRASPMKFACPAAFFAHCHE